MMGKIAKANNKSGEGEFGAHNQIAKGTQIKGDIKTEGVLRIDGTLIGSVESTGKLVVGPSGKIEGSIRCTSANISGEVKANVVVKELLTLQSTAKLHGEITTGKLAIEPGAIFSGKCSMGGVIKDISDKEKENQRDLAERTA
jgi:cytoskeletal protein CcmA (bactofilin family)